MNSLRVTCTQYMCAIIIFMCHTQVEFGADPLSESDVGEIEFVVRRIGGCMSLEDQNNLQAFIKEFSNRLLSHLEAVLRKINDSVSVQIYCICTCTCSHVHEWPKTYCISFSIICTVLKTKDVHVDTCSNLGLWNIGLSASFTWYWHFFIIADTAIYACTICMHTCNIILCNVYMYIIIHCTCMSCLNHQLKIRSC